jgi:hypothetical protein
MTPAVDGIQVRKIDGTYFVRLPPTDTCRDGLHKLTRAQFAVLVSKVLDLAQSEILPETRRPPH